MVDFPNAPNDGDTWFENGQGWLYKDPPGAWALLGGAPVQAVEIVEADAAAGWQVWGDTLIQWGVVAAQSTIVFPKAFKSVPQHVSATPQNADFVGQTVLLAAYAHSVTETGCSLVVNFQSGSTTDLSSAQIAWFAVGEAPDDLKKPKEVAAGSGGIAGGSAGPYYEEFHDPNGEYSWSILGTRLECWGYILPPNSNAFTVNLPKTFKRVPALTIGNQGNWVSGGLAVYNTTFDPDTFTTSSFRVRTTGSNKDWTGHGTRWFGYHCIGEWDGLS